MAEPLISAPGPDVIAHLSNEAYQRIDALSASGLTRLARSPHHFYALTLDPNRPVSEPTAAMRAGTLAHCMILEPDQVAKRYVVVPDDAPRKPTSVQRNAKRPSPETVAAIDWWDRFQAEHSGKDVVDADQMLVAQRQAESIRKLPEIEALLSTDGSQCETSILWCDERTDVLCKCRPDWMTPAGEGVVILDIKTAQSAAPDEFPRSIAKWGYHRQAAHYSEGVARGIGKVVLGFVFAVVESDWPHAAAAYMLDDESMETARAENQRLVSLYAECRRSGRWGGYPNTIQPISLPHWYQP